MELKNPDIRYLNDMKDVLYDQEWAKTAPNLELYYMYRGLKEENGLRYDITVIPSLMLGKEYVKTKGHEHMDNVGEVYIVMEGEATFLVQKREEDEIKDVFVIKAKKDEVAIIPAGYGHFTINCSDKELKMANWMDSEVKSDYQPILDKRGACYYYTLDGWIKNENYSFVPDLSFKEALKEVPQDLSFLKK